MGLFDFFSKKENSNVDAQWDDFCTLNESYKDDIKLEPIYYLKLYGINEINNNLKMKEAAKRDFISTLSNSTSSASNPIIGCLIDYLINRQEIFNNDRLIDFINNLDKDGLEYIANSHTFFSYIQTRERLNDIDNSEIKLIINPLVNALSSNSNQYNNFISKYSKEYKDYFLHIYNIIMDCINTNKKFDNYDFNDGRSRIYFYENAVVVAFNEDENNVSFVINKFKLLDRMFKIKRLFLINSELFGKNYKNIILDEKNFSSLESEFYTKTPYYIFKHNVYGEIEFYYNEDGIELKCNALDNNLFYEIQVETFNYDREEERLLYIRTIEKIIEMKEKILEKLYDYALKMCVDWEEKDEDGNDISIDYLKNNLKLSISISSEFVNNYNDNLVEKIAFTISGCSDDLLGGHSIDAVVEDDNIQCLFQ